MTMSDEDTRAEFARMREAALRQVLAPGAEAAHRTVRRRRRRVAVVSSGLAVLAVAAGVALAQPRTGPPVITPLVVDAAEPTLLSVAEDGAPPDAVRMELKDNPGTVRLKVVCSGSGSGRVTLRTEQTTTTATVTCGTPPVETPIELAEQSEPEWVDLSIEWDPGTRLTDTPDGWSVQVLSVGRD
jgi:hypothetical protein